MIERSNNARRVTIMPEHVRAGLYQVTLWLPVCGSTAARYQSASRWMNCGDGRESPPGLLGGYGVTTGRRASASLK